MFDIVHLVRRLPVGIRSFNTIISDYEGTRVLDEPAKDIIRDEFWPSDILGRVFLLFCFSYLAGSCSGSYLAGSFYFFVFYFFVLSSMIL